MSEKIRFGLAPTEFESSRNDNKVNDDLFLDDIVDGEILLDKAKGNLVYKHNGRIIKLRHNNTYQVLVNKNSYSVVKEDNEATDKYSIDMTAIRSITQSSGITPTVGDILIIKEVNPVSGQTYPVLSSSYDANNEDLYDMRTYIRSDRINDENRNSDTSYDIDNEFAEWLPMGGGVKNKTSDTRLDKDLRVVSATPGSKFGSFNDFERIPSGTSVYDILKRLLQNIVNPTVEKTPYRTGNYSITLTYGYRSWSEYTTGQITIAPGKRFYLPWGGDYEHIKIHALNNYADGNYSFYTANGDTKSSTKQKTGCAKGSDTIRVYFNGVQYINVAYNASTNHNLYYHYDTQPINSNNDRAVIITSYGQGVKAVNNAAEETNIRCAAGSITQNICYFDKYKPHLFLCWNTMTPSVNITTNNGDLSRLMYFNVSGMINKTLPGVNFNSSFELSGFDLNNDREIVVDEEYPYTVKAGTKCIQFYVPDGYQIKEIINPDMMNKDVLNLFTVNQYSNLDLNNYNSGTKGEAEGEKLTFRKYTYTCEIPFSKDVVFKVKYKN